MTPDAPTGAPADALPDALHVPVMLAEVLDALAIQAGQLQVDATFGAGGYTRAMLQAGAAVLAFDRDPDAIRDGAALAADYDGLTLVPATFSAMEAELVARGHGPVDGVTMDIGVSSMQLDQAERGFSFQTDGPLDMRMSQAGPTAADFVNTADETHLANVLYEFGDEPRSRRVAQFIVGARPITRTGELARVVRRALGYKPHDKKDPATRTFQALRIEVNRELGELEDGLNAAERVLKPGGTLAVITFHSGEDRIVKRFLRERSGALPSGSRHMPEVAPKAAPSFESVGRAVRAGEDEIARNPRARSATLRVARRTAAAAWSAGKQVQGAVE